MLRCPVYLKDDARAKNVWWGYVNKVTINDDGQRFSVGLDSMANRIAVAHSYNNQRFTTSWESNTESLTDYGQKDLLLTAREKSATMAAQFRSTELANRRYPVSTVGFRPKKRRGRDLSVRLDCLGWMASLDWRYYAEDEGQEEYQDFGSGEREIGEDDRPKAAQGFQISSAAGWNATSIWLRVKKVGTPADNFQVALWSDTAGVPNAQIEACAVLAGGSITTSYVWYEFVLDSEQALALATQYWIHVSRSGAVDASNYYLIDANREQGYTNGNLFIQRSSDSSWYDKNMDALFRVTGEDSTTDQISDIVSTAGEFFLGTTIDNASGVNSGTYRAGDQTALYEVMELLKTGTTNNRRLLAEVTEIRKLRVFEEPAKDSANYTYSKGGEIRDENDGLVLPQDCPVGVWMLLKDFIPSTANISKLANPSPIFIEEAEYNVDREQYLIKKNRSSVSAAETLTQTIGLG
jgi:hypothetical protein